MADSDFDELAEDVQYLSPMRDEMEKSTTGDFVSGTEEVKMTGKLSPISSVAKRVLIAQSETDDIDQILAETEGTDTGKAVKVAKGGNDEKEGTFPTFFDDAKKYRLLQISKSSQICGAIMGQGVYFCANKNCSVGHRGLDQVKLVDGHLFVINR